MEFLLRIFQAYAISSMYCVAYSYEYRTYLKTGHRGVNRDGSMDEKNEEWGKSNETMIFIGQILCPYL